MLNKIKIENFQSHKKTELDLVPGVNVVVGKSNSGKTAILRALKWLVFNRPLGFRFHSEFTDDPTFVSIEDEINEIGMEKDKNGAIYYVGEQSFEKMGTDIPDLAKEALNLTELNFSDQLNKPAFRLKNIS